MWPRLLKTSERVNIVETVVDNLDVVKQKVIIEKGNISSCLR